MRRDDRWSSDGRPDFAEALPEAVRRVRRSRVGAIAGAVAGLAIAVVLEQLSRRYLAVDALQVVGAVLEVLAASTMGAALGSIAGGGRLAGFLQRFLGYRMDAERIRDAIAGVDAPLDPVRQEKASQYSALAALVLPEQYTRLLLFAVGAGLNQLALLPFAVEGGRLLPLLGVLLLPIYLVLPLRLRRRGARRARDYARQHPVSDGGGGPHGVGGVF